MVCGICKESGHNRRTCTNKPDTGPNVGISTKSDKENKVIGISTSGSARNFSTVSATVQDINQTISSTTQIHDEILDLKKILFKPLLRKHKESIQIPDEKDETIPIPSKSVIEPEEKIESSSSSKRKLKKPSIGIDWLNPKALERLESGPTPEDGPGHIYMYRISNPTSEERNWYKIGLSKDLPARRIRAQEVANKQNYETLVTYETPCRFLTETVIHLQLKSQRTPRPSGDGKTEWFKGDREELRILLPKLFVKLKLYI